MQLRILAVVCVFNAISLRIPSEVKNLGFNSELLTRPMNDISSLVETLMQADPAQVQEIIDLLLVLKNDSVTTEEYLVNEVEAASLETSNAQTALDDAIEARENAEEALTLAQNDEATRNTEYIAAQLTENQTQANLDHQKPLLDHDQETIDVVIGHLQDMMNTSAPTSSPTTSPTSFTSPTSTPDGCVPYSEQACIDAADKLGLQLGGLGYAFVGDYSIKGCYAYESGAFASMAYYGSGGSEAEMREQLGAPTYRPIGYDCAAGIQD